MQGAPAVGLVRGFCSKNGSGDMYPAASDVMEPWIPPYEERVGESMELKKAR